jgi:hypothetical protein
MRRTWNLDFAREMYAAGTSYRNIAVYFGTDATTVRMRLDREYAAKRLERANERRRKNPAKKAETDREARAYITEVTATKRAAGIIPSGRSGTRVEADWLRHLPTIPKSDTRSLTGRLAGDPLPGRSALDMRKQQETRA